MTGMDDLSGETVLVTGGAGFVGSQLVRELLELGAHVVVYDNLLHGTRENLDDVSGEITLVVGDVLDEWKLSATFMEHRPGYVFDLVGDTYVPTAYEIPKRFFRINTEGTLNILSACKLFGVKRMLYVSSTEVYGEARSIPMTEDHPLQPANTYAVSKLAADRLCFTFHKEHGIPVVMARIFNAYGPRATEPYVIPEIITQFERGDVLHLGNLKARRDFTYVSDTALGLMQLMTSEIADGEAVNVGSNVTHSVEELAALCAEVMGKTDYEIKVDPRRLRRHDVEIFQCDPSRLRTSTGWEPQVSIVEGLGKTVQWFRDHGSRWSWESWTEGAIVYDGVA